MARFSTYTVGSQVHRAPQGPQVRVPERARGELRRHARRRQAPEAPDRPVGDLHRRDVPPPRLPRRRRHAADRRGIRPVHGLDRPRQAGEADRRTARPQGVRRDLGQQVGRDAPDQVVDPDQLQGDVPLLQLAGRAALARTCRWTRWSRNCSAPTAARSRTRRRTSTRTRPTILPLSENVAQVFMGMRVQCAQCHNHPFDRWTQDDYYGFAAFFSQIGRKQGEDYRETIVFNSGGGEMAHPVGGAGDEAEVPRRRCPRRRRQGPPRHPRQVARLEGEPLVRHVVRQSRLGPLHGRGDRRAGG